MFGAIHKVGDEAHESLASSTEGPTGPQNLLNVVQISVETPVREALGLGGLEVSRVHLLPRMACASSSFTRYMHFKYLKYLYNGTVELCSVKSGVCLFSGGNWD